MSPHEKFYALRDEVWSMLEELVRSGCDYIGDFPVDDDSSRPLVITGIVKDETYHVHPPKTSPKDIIVTTNKVKVKMLLSGEVREVTPDLNEIQWLSTYVSGGYDVYDKSESK